MDRRKARATKRILFEPRIPDQKAPEQSEEVAEAPVQREAAREEDVQLRGLFAPVSFASERTLDLERDGVVLSIPPSLTGATLVVFSDGTLALRKGETLYTCDSTFLGDAMTVEITDSVRKTGDVQFVVTGYEMPMEQ